MTPSFTSDILLLLTAYVLGAIPFGILVSWLFDLGDPRTKGSGNIGATNILRLGNKGAAGITLFFDALKGSAAVLLAFLLNPSLAQWAALLAVMGHIWSLWLGFRGGKGIATAFGTILVLSWPLAISCLITWLVVAFTTRYSSLSSLASIVLSPLYAFVLEESNLIALCIAFAGLLTWTHRDNIGRLLTGRETKIGESTLSGSSQD